MRIGIWHWSTGPFDGRRVRDEPAGGTETAIAYTAEALVERGADVSIWCNVGVPCTVEGVRYLSAEGLRRSARTAELDAWIVVRHLAALLVPVRTRAVAYWTHDNLGQPFMHGALRFSVGTRDNGEGVACFPLGDLAEELDLVLAVSRFQADAITRELGVDANRIAIIGNGLQPGLHDPRADLFAKRPIVLYSLPPDRGFVPLLEIFASLSPSLPDAELHLYSRSTIYGVSDEEDRRRYGELYALAKAQPRVRHFDPVDQRTLALAMREAMVYAYPTRTEETFCISILEAQAEGAVPVSSAIGALPERIEAGVDGFLIEGDPEDPPVRRRFAAKISQLLTDSSLRISMAEAARRRAFSPGSSFRAVAERMLAALAPLVDARVPRMRMLDLERWPMPFPARTSRGTVRHLDARELDQLAQSYERLLHLS